MDILFGIRDRDLTFLHPAVSIHSSFPEKTPQSSFTVGFRFGSKFLCSMFIWERFYGYYIKKVTSKNMSLGARGHSFGSRDFKMVVLSTIVPRRFLSDNLIFLEGRYGNTPLSVYGNIPSSPNLHDFQL